MTDLGIRPSHTAFAIHSAASAASSTATATAIYAMLQLLINETSIPPRNVRVLAGRPYTDGLRIGAVNAHLRTLPADAWLIFADHDELFSYAHALGRNLRMHACACYL